MNIQKLNLFSEQQRIENWNYAYEHSFDFLHTTLPRRVRRTFGFNAGIRLTARLVAKNRKGRITGMRQHDMGLAQIALFIQQNILVGVGGAAVNITDTGNSARSINPNTATGTIYIVAGTTGTGPAFTDYKLGAQSASTSGYVAATVNALNTGTGIFTVTGTITNSSGSTITYAEVGVTIICATYTFCLARDTFTGLPVSDGGTLGVTYSVTTT